MRLLIMVWLLASSAACTTVTQSDLAKRDEYLLAMSVHAEGDPQGARDSLPKKERGGFITSLEKGWLGVLAGSPDTEPLLPIGRDLENRKTLSVHKEASSFFYKETEDGYFPAEHEAIALHLVTGFAFAEKKQWMEAKVEARKAAFYLQNDFGSGPGFDDPALRMWLASLWAATGEWDSARVDFRALGNMGKRYAWAKKLAARSQPLANLAVVFVGPGPDVAWVPNGATDLDRIAFVPGTKPMKIETANRKPVRAASAAVWYKRHQERDREIRQVVQKSRYMAEGVLPATAAGATATVGVAVGTTIAVGGLALGLGVAVAGVVVGIKMGTDLGGYVAGAGLVGGAFIAKRSLGLGVDVIDSSNDVAGDLIDQGFNPTNAYRYVRFLPDFVMLTQGEVQERMPFATMQGGATTVRAYYAAGNGSSVVAASNAYVEDGRRWVFVPRRTSRDDALKTCATLPLPARGAPFRLPTWVQVLDAKANGLFDPNRNSFALSLAGEAWLNEEGGGRPGTCHFLDGKDLSQTPTQNCAEPRLTLCLSPSAKGRSRTP